MGLKLLSMTGFGSFSADTEIGNVQIEIKSVNARFLDVFVLTNSDTVRSFEGAIKKKITDNELVKRGKVECRITVASNKNKEVSIGQLSQEALEQLIELQKLVKKSTKAKSLTVNEILLFPGILSPMATLGEKFEIALLNGVGEALDRFNDSREQEGEKLAKVLVSQCDQIDKLVSDLRPRIPDIIASLEQKLTQRLEEALAEQLATNSTLSKEEVNERIRQEVTLYATRMDVAEEMDRLNTHTQNIRETILKGGPVGRKLDFIIQELNREANTLASKSTAIEMTDTAVQLKVCVEQMREQIQNMQ